MANNVLDWVWDHSRSRHGARLVMLAIADRADDRGNAWPSVPDIMRRTQLGERAVQAGIIEAAKLGELEVGYQEGPKGCNRYRILMTKTPADIAPPQILRGAESAPPQNSRGSESSQVSGQHPAISAPPADIAPPQISTPDPADSADEPPKEPSLNSPTESSTEIAADPGALFDAPGSKPSGRKAAAKHPVATRIPDDFAIDAGMRQWAREKIAGYDIDAETENFIDWWRSKPGAAATKTDWPATWRTWMRKNATEAGYGRRNGSTPARGKGPKQTNYSDEEYASGWR